MAERHVWNDLVSTALVGTARRAVPDTDAPASDRRTDPALALLDHAALATVRRRAGHLPCRVEPIAPAPDDPAEPVSDAAGTRLVRMLRGEHADCLPEWLGLAAAAGRRLPLEHLPDLLDLGIRDRSLRPVLARTVGVRGHWLAGLNPAWNYLDTAAADDAEAAVSAFDQDVWDTGTRTQRRAHLAALRAADPAAARRLIESVWSGERAEQRRELLDALADGLGPDDEEFLSSAAADRAVTVQEVAAKLLSRLPGSAQSRATAELARRFVRTGGAVEGLRGLRVILPDAAEPGFPEALRPQRRGGSADLTRSELLRALIAHTPLDTWPEHLGGTPKAITKAARAAKHEVLLGGLADAAITQRDLDWIRALVPLAVSLGEVHANDALRPISGTLLALLPLEDQCAAVVEAAHVAPRTAPLVGDITGEWSTELSELVIERLKRYAADSSGHWHSRRPRVSRQAGHGVPPHLHTLVEPPGSGPHDNPDIANLAATLRFRSDMHQELK